MPKLKRVKLQDGTIEFRDAKTNELIESKIPSENSKKIKKKYGLIAYLLNILGILIFLVAVISSVISVVTPIAAISLGLGGLVSALIFFAAARIIEVLVNIEYELKIMNEKEI